MFIKPNSIQIIFSILGGLFLLFIAAPLIHLMTASSGTTLIATVKDPEVNNSIALSLMMSAFATLAASIFIIPLAWLMARNNFFGKRFVAGLIDIPMMIPHSAAGIALLGIVNRESAFGRFASHFGIDFIDHPAGIAIAMAFVSVPYLFNAAHSAFNDVSLRTEQAAQNLGANPWRVFFTISLPLAKHGILNGFVMMFARGMSEFGSIVIIAYNPFTTPVLIFDRFNAFGLKDAQAISAIFIIISLAVFIGVRLLTKPRENVRN